MHLGLDISSDGRPIRLSANIAHAEDRVYLQGVEGARENKDGTKMYLPLEPLVINDLREAYGDDLEMSSACHRWYEDYLEREQRAVLYNELSDTPTGIFWDAALYGFQRVGATWLAKNRGGILADQPGLGKSAQALSAVELLKPAAFPVLIVCPAYVIQDVWVAEIQKWLPGAKVAACQGNPKRRHEILAQGAPYTVINYEMLRTVTRTVGDGLKVEHCEYGELFTKQWGAVIFDEAHKIHNRRSSQAEGAATLKRRYTFLLTGTPVWNKPDSLWHLLHLLDPERFSSYWSFVNQYCLVRETPWAKEIVGPKLRQLPQLRRIILPYLLRRLKTDVAPQLPPKIYRAIGYDLTAEQEAMYNEVEKNLRLELTLAADDGIDLFAQQFTSVAASLSTLRRICNAPSLVEERASPQSAKISVIKDLVSDLVSEDTKILIFCWHKDFGRLLLEQLKSKQYNSYYIDGDTSAEARSHTLHVFKQDPHSAILVGTIGALGTGLSIPEATTAIFAEIDWTPANNEQAEDRIHRIVGTTVSPTIYYVYARGTIEQDIYETVQTKASMADKVLAMREVIRRLLAKSA